ncbi:hypothetical protein BC834DRAFT_57611 [Gloeopeniophorella convolvens]|nr:hypothetical protein BC834DRAFT_57611 [Gloeopeniophorella convolvens]
MTTVGPRPDHAGTSNSARLREELQETYLLAHSCPVVDILSDDILLEIFDFYRLSATTALRSGGGPIRYEWPWDVLAHVCRRWRRIVFASPRRLNLRLVCTYRTPVRVGLPSWPSLPILANYDHGRESLAPGDEDNIVFVFKFPYRLYRLSLSATSSLVSKLSVARLGKPLPMLEYLSLQSESGSAIVFPKTFLFGPARSLRYISLANVTLPALPRLLSSAKNLVHLELSGAPSFRHVSPATLVFCLSILPRFCQLHVRSSPPSSHPSMWGRHRPPLRALVALKMLTVFSFRGTSEELESLVARFDAPCLRDVNLELYNQLVFDLPQLTQFLSRTKDLGPFVNAHIQASHQISLKLRRHAYPSKTIRLAVLCEPLDWQISAMAQLSHYMSPVLSTVKQLTVSYLQGSLPSQWRGTVEPAQWVEFLRQFSRTETLFVPGALIHEFAQALCAQSHPADAAVAALPALRELIVEIYFNEQGGAFVEAFNEQSGMFMEALKPFVDARRLAGSPVVVRTLH